MGRAVGRAAGRAATAQSVKANAMSPMAEEAVTRMLAMWGGSTRAVNVVQRLPPVTDSSNTLRRVWAAVGAVLLPRVLPVRVQVRAVWVVPGGVMVYSSAAAKKARA